MTRNNFSTNAVAKASVQQKFLDARTARQHVSLASFAHELELVQESYEFGLAARHEVTEVEDQLIATWRDFIELSSPISGHSSNWEEAPNRKHH